jgi:hypothetical protein
MSETEVPIPQEFDDNVAQKLRMGMQPHQAPEAVMEMEQAAEVKALIANRTWWQKFLDYVIPYRSRAIYAERRVTVLLFYNAFYLKQSYELRGAMAKLEQVVGFQLAKTPPPTDKERRAIARRGKRVNGAKS